MKGYFKMTRLRKSILPARHYKNNGILLEALNPNDLQKHFSITDIPNQEIGTYIDFPAATVVFDLSGSSLNIRTRGAKEFAAETQYTFKVLTDIIYAKNGIVEKFPGDGISMHFPANDSGEEVPCKERAIHNACEAIMQMDYFLHTKRGLARNEYRFSLAYGDETIVTIFGSPKHQEIISIGHAVNVAHKLEKKIKEANCFVGMDDQCKIVAENVGFSFTTPYLMPSDLYRNIDSPYEFWFGVKY
jgi:hypothetical protein